MNKPLISAALGLALLAVSGCASDPAVRLAHCMKRGAQRLAERGGGTHVELCRLGTRKRSAAVLYPAKAISDDELVALGVPPELVGVLRSMQFPGPPDEGVFVIPEEGHDFPSRTTAHKRWVRIGKLIVVHAQGGKLELILQQTPAGIEVLDLR